MVISFQINGVSKLIDSHTEIDNTKTKWVSLSGTPCSAVTTGLFRVILVKDQILFSLNPYIV